MNKKHDCKDELKDLELKATPARIAVMQILESSEKPIDVSDIIESLKKKKINADQATIFRIMNIFTEKGVTKPVLFHEGKTRYELFSKEDHHHLVCSNCGIIEDISDCNIPDLEKDIRKKKGFLVKSHSLEFFGLCKTCQH